MMRDTEEFNLDDFSWTIELDGLRYRGGCE